jgi:inositol-phosphate transport system substrate-binding protein
MNRLQGIKPAALGAALVLPMAAANIEVAAEEVTIKLWSRADRSGPLRTGNIVAAVEPLNAALKAAGSDTTVKVEAFENPAEGYDQDALDLLKAFSVGQGPDVYVAAHSRNPATP